MQSTSYPELERILEWFLGFIKPVEWCERKREIEKRLEDIHRPKKSHQGAINHQSISFQKHDKMGWTMSWYLYLAEMLLTEPTKYEAMQGARVIPIFERLGADLELLHQIGGINEKVERLLSFGKKGILEPDATLFEILVALLWKRNGWDDVSFKTESTVHKEKTPDIRAASGNNEWIIECKRLNGRSEYSEKERKKWLRMWIHLRNYLIDKRIPAIFEIVFHVELESLSDDFLVKQLAGKLPFLSSQCIVISNEQLQISFDTVNFDKAREHLERFSVKMGSSQLCELIAGYRNPNRGFTHVVLGGTEYSGDGRSNNKYLTTMDFAAGAFWHCDAEKSIDKKARDTRKRLVEGFDQLPKDRKSVVHVGLETLDGVLVEKKRYERIFNTVMNFDNQGKDLRWIYCHSFQSYSPPEQTWFYDETVSYFNHTEFTEQPLEYMGVMVTEKDISIDGVHWLRDVP
ncbi:hypothetical protein V3O24_10355 [Methylobacter sp. Wu8]|uniref:hypothetical protein n=1 Tax=Methylobacter sp. Wu8 TaxID=3118457 RepID=UPI002F31C73C